MMPAVAGPHAASFVRARPLSDWSESDHATLRQAPVPRTAGDSTVAYDGLLFAGGGMYGQILAYAIR
jgi:hypothetical protein